MCFFDAECELLGKNNMCCFSFEMPLIGGASYCCSVVFCLLGLY